MSMVAFWSSYLRGSREGGKEFSGEGWCIDLRGALSTFVESIECAPTPEGKWEVQVVWTVPKTQDGEVGQVLDIREYEVPSGDREAERAIYSALLWGLLHEFKEGTYFCVEADTGSEYMVPFADPEEDHVSFGPNVGIEPSMRHMLDAIPRHGRQGHHQPSLHGRTEDPLPPDRAGVRLMTVHRITKVKAAGKYCEIWLEGWESNGRLDWDIAPKWHELEKVVDEAGLGDRVLNHGYVGLRLIVEGSDSNYRLVAISTSKPDETDE